MALLGDGDDEETERQDQQATLSSSVGPSGLETGKEEDRDNDEEEEEDEDADFNPYLIANTLSEASSGLSSDDDVLGDVAHKELANSLDFLASDACQAKRASNSERDSGSDCGEVVTQQTEGTSGKDEAFVCPNQEALASDSQLRDKNMREGKRNSNPSNSQSDAVQDAPKKGNLEEVSCSQISKDGQIGVTDIDYDGAICKRTRAHHSLENYTLDELEAFLQDSDNEFNLQSVDDEEEYHKFLASVLVGGDEDDVAGSRDADIDEDEDNDVDFEIEIEEALESDNDDCSERDKQLNMISGGDGHRPETRQKRSQKKHAKLVGPTTIPLRPILPSMSNAHPGVFGHYLTCPPKDSLHCSSSTQSLSLNVDLAYGFTAQQIGQLYSLIHEHVQLMIQVFSLCVLDPSRQHIANDVRRLIIEMSERREEALAQRKSPYPVFCFDDLHAYQSENLELDQTFEGSTWAPLVRQPLLSILDVAPLCLTRVYLTDVSSAVLKYRDNQVEAVLERSHMTKEPLFRVPECISACEESSEIINDGATSEKATSPMSSSLVKQRKSLAAVLVENTKKQSIAYVAKSIADLAQRFVPLFNSALFPRKAPSLAITNRVLFTDSEDRLLAMGLMEYNNDWEAIRRHFLPCKTTHQIFVRQKNRSSSKAPENPIKAVRRMKTSPLTANEMSLISRGLKFYKNDWIAVRNYCLPHRGDPSLLQRQWRIATGTQKSYKKSEIVKEKRRSYQAKKRMQKLSKACQLSMSEKEGCVNRQIYADNVDEEDEAYVHEAFLAESEHGGSKLILSPSSQASALSHHLLKTTALKVVKLAPGLPPVNLPPSVRVISRADFKNYNIIPPQPNNEYGMVKFFPQRLDNIVSKNHGKIINTQDSSGRIDQYASEDSQLDSSFQMHPLLFQASEDGYLPYHKENCDNVASNTINILTENNIQNNLSIVKSSQVNGASCCAPRTGHLKDSLSKLCTIDFHPLLQRVEGENVDYATICQDTNVSGDLDATRSNCASGFSAYNGAPCEQQANQPNGLYANQFEKENGLDLDIHLYSATESGKHVNSIASGEVGNVWISSGSFVSGGIRQPDNVGVLRNKPVLAIPSSYPTKRKLIRSEYVSQGPNEAYKDGLLELTSARDDSFKFTGADGADEFFSEIVMEQEELSDSDEDIEHVEFEREEIEDSEGEEFDGETLASTHNKEITASLSGNLMESTGNCEKSEIVIGSDPSIASSSRSKPKAKAASRAPSLNCSQSRLDQNITHSKSRIAKGSKPRPLKKPKVSLTDTGACGHVTPRKSRKRSTQI